MVAMTTRMFFDVSKVSEKGSKKDEGKKNELFMALYCLSE